jgi:glyoxylase-like metal-dependent hydrolase (beta-lactamase superfamily II)
VQTTDLAAVRWIHGSPPGEPSTDPALQVVALDDDTFVIRQGKNVHFEAPFVYLLVGAEVALLHDSGATPEVDRFPIRRTVEELIGARGPRILVTHSHGHGDHWAGDAQFADLSPGSVVPIGQEAVARFLGIEDWPSSHALLDLGDRAVDVLPTPGHLGDHVVLFDRMRGLLLSGDMLLPGRLTVRDWTAYRKSVRRLARFARETAARGRPIRAILGGHIELSRSGDLYDLGTTYQPDEVPLPLTVDDLFALDAMLEDAGDEPRAVRSDRFVVEPVPSEPPTRG